MYNKIVKTKKFTTFQFTNLQLLVEILYFCIFVDYFFMKKEKNHFQDYKDFLKPPKVGDIIKAKVIYKGKGGVFLEVDNFKIGIIKKNDLDQAGYVLSKINIGDELVAKIIDIENDEGVVELSLREANEEMVWQKFSELAEKKEKISLKVKGANKGGLIFNFSGVQGFLPASQLSTKHYPKIENPTPERIFEELKKLVDKELEVKILTIDQRNGKLILSEK